MTIRSYPTGEDAEGIFDSARIQGPAGSGTGVSDNPGREPQAA
jgi:hypothetical protein